MSIDNVQDISPRIQYTAAAAQSSFAYPFPIFEDGDLAVLVDGVASSAYTVSGAGADTGGDVNFTTPMAGGEIVTIYRDMPIERTSDFQQNGPWTSQTLNDELDRITLVAQQLKAGLARALQLPVTTSATGAEVELGGAAWHGKYVTIDSNGIPTPAVLLANTVTAQILGDMLYPATEAEDTAAVTLSASQYRPYDFRRYGALDDGTTDNTAAIVAVLGAFSSSFSGMFYAAPNVKFNADTVYAALPLRAVLHDESQINAWNTAGFRQKTVGYAEGEDDSAVNDFQQVISSGHNAALNLDNRGTASSSSGQLGVAMVQWSRGRLTKQTNENGFRALARVEFSKIPGVNKWWYLLRRGVPWAANSWEYWYTGKSYTTGDHVLTATGVYVAASTGTTGATEPSHTTGTVSDGGVSWTVVIPNLDSGIFGIDQHGQIFTNTSPVDAVVAYLKADKYSPGGGQANLYIEADGTAQNALLRLRPTNSSGSVSVQPVILAQDGVGLRFMKSDVTDEYFRLDDTNGFTWQSNPAVKRVTLTYSASMTPDAKLGASQIVTATNNTAFTFNVPANAVLGRRLRITLRNTSGGALGAATWNAIFKMPAWTNPGNGNSRSVEFEYDGTYWVEISRTASDVPN